MKNFFLVAIVLTMAAVKAHPLMAEPGLEIESHTAGDFGFAVNSHLIYGAKQALLVDAQFTDEEATKVVALVKKSRRTLKTIFITHGHPDHYFGATLIAKAFPSARVVATPEVIRDIEATAKGKLEYWGGVEAYKGKLTQTIVTVKPVEDLDLSIDGEQLEQVALGAGEAEHLTALYVKSRKALVAGDLIFGGVHLWLAESRPTQWLEQLNRVRTDLALDQVFSGHGDNGDKSLIDVNEQYIQTFIQATKTPVTKSKAAEIINAKYGKYRLPIILDIALDSQGLK